MRVAVVVSKGRGAVALETGSAEALYAGLGVRRVINAAAAQTTLGGSIMPPPVVAAMAAAAGAYVDLVELHDRVGERLAALTRNEAACVSCGAAAGVLLATAACLAGDDPALAAALPETAGLARDEVIVWLGQRSGFWSGARGAGARLVEIGPDGADLAEALGPRTAAVLWFEGTPFRAAAPPLAEVVSICRRAGVPVIVDAADQVPPLAALWRSTRETGADLAIFSGGKGLKGPQASGLIVGRADLIRACRVNAGPGHSVGRPAKVGKEELVGLLAAVEWAFAADEAAMLRGYGEVVAGWLDGLAGVSGVRVERDPESHIGQPIPRAVVRLGSAAARDAAVAALWAGVGDGPRIAVLPHGEDGIALNPQGVQAGEASIVLAATVRAVTGAGGMERTGRVP